MSCRISIPTPCHEDWNEMTPNDRGRHCSSCDKTVIDFTLWQLEDIAAYLRKHREKKVCGRFKNHQLGVEIPYTDEQWVIQVAGTATSWSQKLMLIFLFAFGILSSGCHNEQASGDGLSSIVAPDRTMGEPIPAAVPLMGKVAVTDTTKSCSATASHQTSATDSGIGGTSLSGEVYITAGAPVLEHEPEIDTAQQPVVK